MRRFWTSLLTLCLLGFLAGCGAQTPPEPPSDAETPVPEIPAPEPPEDPDKDYAIYDCGEIQIALPAEHLDLLMVDTAFPDAAERWKPLISVYERASVEAAEADWGEGSGAGFLFGVLAMDRAGYEQLLCEALPGVKVIAAEGERYYARTFPTDVQFYRSGGIDMESAEWRTWETLNQMDGAVMADMIRRNGLTPCDGAELFTRSFTWEGPHACLRFCHPGKYGEDAYVLALSQPVRQGAGGVWCVDRWMYEGADPMIWFPDTGLPAGEYYAGLQAACDAGEHPELLTPAGAAAAFIRDYFGTEPAEEDLHPLDAEAEARAMADLRLRELVAEVYAGKDVDGMALLACLGLVGEDNWASLGMLEPVGLEGDWWPALLAALEGAAVGGDQPARDRDMMAFCLTIREDLSRRREAVARLVRTQRESDGGAFAAALESFSPEEQAYLKAAVDVDG